MSAHTPSPWTVRRTPHHWVIEDEHGQQIARVHITDRDYTRRTGNVSLIVAAPDLLEACEAMWEMLGRERTQWSAGVMMGKAIKKARGA